MDPVGPPGARRGKQASAVMTVKGTQPCPHLLFVLLAPGTVREDVAAVLSLSACSGNVLQQPQKTNPVGKPWASPLPSLRPFPRVGYEDISLVLTPQGCYEDK